MNRTSEKGAVAFYILLAIVLLAALTYAVSQGSRTGANSITEDQARLAASEILDYGNTVARAVQKLKLRGCDETEISFQSSQWHNTSLYDNTSAPADESCHIFNVNAGAINFSQPNESWLSSSNPRYHYGYFQFIAERVYNVGSNSFGPGDYGKDLLFQVPFISKNICEKINEKLYNITTIPIGNVEILQGFKGTYGSTGQIIPDAHPFTGKMAGCVEGSGSNLKLSSGEYGFYQVLLAR